MALSRDIGTFLQASGIGLLAPIGSAVTNEDIFTEQQPDDPPDVISIHRQAGLAPDMVMESNLPAISKPGVQLRIRGAAGNHVATEDRGELVRDTMDKLREFTIGGNRYMKAVRAGDLSNLSEDANGRRTYVLNYVLWMVAC